MSANLSSKPAPPVDGAGRRVLLVCARFNDVIVDRLEAGARTALIDAGVNADDVTTVYVPGALEIPLALRAGLSSGEFDAGVALGVIIRGETYHFEVVANESARGVMDVALATGVVVTNAILTVEDQAQAEARSGAGIGNKGAEAARGALELLDAIEALNAKS
jgi:6,7-dimethyl-8-ribityllumazine synthase